MSFYEIITSVGLLGGIIGVYVKMRIDLASLDVKVHDIKENYQKLILDISKIDDNKIDSKFVEIMRRELKSQIEQWTNLNAIEHAEIKKSLEDIRSVLLKR